MLVYELLLGLGTEKLPSSLEPIVLLLTTQGGTIPCKDPYETLQGTQGRRVFHTDVTTSEI